MSMARRDLLVRSGAVAAWAGGAGCSSRTSAAHSTGRLPSTGATSRNRGAPPSPSCAPRATRAISRVCWSTGSVSSGRRSQAVGALEPNLVEFTAGRRSTCRPPMVVAAADALRRLGAASVVVAEGPGHRRDTEAS